MDLLISIINYIALAFLFIGLGSVLKSKFKVRDITFLIGTILLTLGATLSWSTNQTLEIFAFILLFALQVIANILQIKSENEKLNTTTLLILSIILFIAFFFAGLFTNSFFFLIAIGTVLAGFGYREKPEHAVRQSVLFGIAAIFESLFAYFTEQYFYIYLNLVFILFAVLIIRKGIKGQLSTEKLPEVKKDGKN